MILRNDGDWYFSEIGQSAGAAYSRAAGLKLAWGSTAAITTTMAT